MMLQHERGYYSPRWAAEPRIHAHPLIEAPATEVERRALSEREERRRRQERKQRACSHQGRVLRTPFCPECGALCTPVLAPMVPPNDHANTIRTAALFRAWQTLGFGHGG